MILFLNNTKLKSININAKIINDYRLLEQSTEILKSIAHLVRLGIVMLLLDRKSLVVSTLQKLMDIGQAVTCYHFKIMKNSVMEEVKQLQKITIYKIKEDI